MTAVTNAESLPNESRRKTGIAGFLLFFTDKHKQNKREHSHFHHALDSLPSVVFPNTMKKKNKLLLCFRPLTDQDRIATNPGDSNLLLPSKHKTTEFSKFKSDQEALRNTRRRSRSFNASSRNFCSDLKSVLVEPSLQQQKQRRYEANAARPTLRSKSMHHDSNNSSRSLARVGSVEDGPVPILSSSISETERRTSMPFSQIDSLPKSRVHADAKSRSLNSGLFIFAMSLCATIFCGRVCAILFTLIFFYCMPSRTCVDSRYKNVLKLPQETEKEYRKRVIMEGLLERNHHLCRGKLLRRKEVIRHMYDKLKPHHSVAIPICFRFDGY